MINPNIQEYFDREEFDPESGYVALSKREGKIRHIHLHVAKAALKLAQHDESVIVDEVLPDTAMYRSQLFNVIGAEKFDDIPRMFPDKISSRVGPRLRESDTLESMVVAGGLLATYLERKEHGRPADEHNLVDATVKLHEVAVNLGARFAVDVDQVHLRRLEQRLGQPVPADLQMEIWQD